MLETIQPKLKIADETSTLRTTTGKNPDLIRLLYIEEEII
jgi:hypothetical protein